ncbi:MAG: hypothetical protein LUQ37_09845, partial [Methanoregulaceae archaeon]|nr:hypothetical protein [Methanoregulaceae archaeon]
MEFARHLGKVNRTLPDPSDKNVKIRNYLDGLLGEANSACIVWSDRTLLNVTTRFWRSIVILSMVIDAGLYFLSARRLNTCLPPEETVVSPDGEIVPPLLLVAFIIYWFGG